MILVVIQGGGHTTGSTTQVVVYILGGVGVAGVLALARLIYGMSQNVRHISDVLVGPKATKFDDEPRPGFLEMVRTHDKTLKSHTRTLGVLLTGQQAMLNQRVGERLPDGQEMRPPDALRRIQEEKHRLALEHLEEPEPNGDEA